MNGGASGTARYLARHSLFRIVGAALGGLMRVTGLLVLALVGVAVWCLIRWPTVTVIVLLVLYWRHRRRNAARARALAAVDPIAREKALLAVDLLRARVLAAHMKLDPDVQLAAQDYREGRITRADYDTAVTVAAADRAARQEAAKTDRFRFQH